MSNASPSFTSKKHPLQHATWGNKCDAFTLMDTEALSIKQEAMPANTAEELHYHKEAQQFFYILQGEAVFEIDYAIILLQKGEGIEVSPGIHHRILNKQTELLEFLVCSQPSTVNDRHNVA